MRASKRWQSFVLWLKYSSKAWFALSCMPFFFFYFSSTSFFSFALSVFVVLLVLLFLHFLLLFVLVVIPHLLLLLLVLLFSVVCIAHGLMVVLHLSVLHLMLLSPGLLLLLFFSVIFLHVWSVFATPHLFRDALSPSPWGFIIHPSQVLCPTAVSTFFISVCSLNASKSIILSAQLTSQLLHFQFTTYDHPVEKISLDQWDFSQWSRMISPDLTFRNVWWCWSFEQGPVRFV